jgi:hypothetical protein
VTIALLRKYAFKRVEDGIETGRTLAKKKAASRTRLKKFWGGSGVTPASIR